MLDLPMFPSADIRGVQRRMVRPQRGRPRGGDRAPTRGGPSSSAACSARSSARSTGRSCHRGSRPRTMKSELAERSSVNASFFPSGVIASVQMLLAPPSSAGPTMRTSRTSPVWGSIRSRRVVPRPSSSVTQRWPSAVQLHGVVRWGVRGTGNVAPSRREMMTSRRSSVPAAAQRPSAETCKKDRPVTGVSLTRTGSDPSPGSRYRRSASTPGVRAHREHLAWFARDPARPDRFPDRGSRWRAVDRPRSGGRSRSCCPDWTPAPTAHPSRGRGRYRSRGPGRENHPPSATRPSTAAARLSASGSSESAEKSTFPSDERAATSSLIAVQDSSR